MSSVKTNDSNTVTMMGKFKAMEALSHVEQQSGKASWWSTRC